MVLSCLCLHGFLLTRGCFSKVSKNRVSRGPLVLHKHIFRLFGPPPTPMFISIFYVLKISKNWHFLTPLPLQEVLKWYMNGPSPDPTTNSGTMNSNLSDFCKKSYKPFFLDKPFDWFRIFQKFRTRNSGIGCWIRWSGMIENDFNLEYVLPVVIFTYFSKFLLTLPF